jgi:hypothetical protein
VVCKQRVAAVDSLLARLYILIFVEGWDISHGLVAATGMNTLHAWANTIAVNLQRGYRANMIPRPFPLLLSTFQPVAV